MDNHYTFYNKIVKDPTEISRTLAYWKFRQFKVVFTNGCFDIIHRGHVEYLYQASLLGDVLILGLNTDESVRRIKGSGRPVIDEESRSIVLAAMEFIDMIVLFNEDTPLNLINSIKPDILVKGNDYKTDEIVGSDVVRSYGGKIQTVPLVEGFSTTTIIDKLKKQG